MTESSVGVRGIVHDLNNQLMIVLNCLDQVMILHPEIAEARKALMATERCAEIAAQLSPARNRHARTSHSLREILCESASLIRSLLHAGQELALDCHSSLDVSVRAIAASSDIQQILVNLCLNSIEAMNGPGLIRISASTLNASACLRVTDNGPGIPGALLERIFEPNFTTKSARGGTGLGLARVRELAARSGGSVVALPVYPHGAQFEICLPLA